MVVADIFIHGIVTVLWRLGAIVGNGYGIQWHNYVAIYQGSKLWAGLHYGNLI